MELYQYLFKKKIKQQDFKKIARCKSINISKIVLKKTSPSLLTAVAFIKATDGLVKYEELLSEQDEKTARELGIL